MGEIFKISIFGHEIWSLAKVPEVEHILSFYSMWSKWSLIFALWAVVSDIKAHFQNCHIWAWNLATGKRSRVSHMLAFYSRGSKLSLFSLYGQRFLRYGPICKIATFGHETWPLVKVPEVAHTLSFYPMGQIELIFALRAAVSEIWADFQNYHIWAWNLIIGKSYRCFQSFFFKV